MFIINRIIWIFNILAGLALLVSYLAPYVDPRLWWVMAFFGLAFPILFIVNLIFTLWWLIQGKLKVIFPVACLLLGFSHFSKIYKISGKEAPEDQKAVQFMSMNVKGFGFFQNQSFLDSVTAYLVSEKIDVVCFQEFWNHQLTAKQDVIAFLKKKAGFSHVRFNGSDNGSGTIIFSKFPIVHSGKLEFSSRTVNGAVWADVKFPGNHLVRVFCLHLQSNNLTKKEEIRVSDIDNNKETVEKSKNIIKRLKHGFEERSEQVAMLLGQMDSCKHPLIVAGDFNDTQLSYCYRKLRGDRKDAFVESGKGMGNTYVGPFPSYRIDYIFFDKSFKGYAYSSGPNFGSDHKLIRTKIVFE